MKLTAFFIAYTIGAGWIGANSTLTPPAAVTLCDLVPKPAATDEKKADAPPEQEYQPPEQVVQLLKEGKLQEATAEMEKWAATRVRLLEKEGRAAARLAPPTAPPQVRELIAIDKTLGKLGGKPAGGEGMEVVKGIMSIWADTLVKKLYKEGRTEAVLGKAEPPEQVRQMIDVSRDAAQLGIENPGLDRAMTVATLWGDSLATKRLRTAKPKIETAAADAPLELKDVFAGALVFRGWLDAQQAKMNDRAQTAAHKWYRNRVNRYVTTANTSGVATTPVQIDSIFKFADTNNCLDAPREGAIDAARSIGEKNLNAYKDKLPCDVTDAQKDVVKKLAGDLEARGWGPYDKDVPGCGWSGRIVITTITKEDQTKEHRGGGAGVRERLIIEDTLRYEVAVDGVKGEARKSGNGMERLIRKNIGAGCTVDSLDQTTTRAIEGSASIPVDVKDNYGGRFTITFPDLAYKIKSKITTITNGTTAQCGPMARGPENTTKDRTLDMSASSQRMIVSQPGEPIAGTKKGMLLKHSETFTYGNTRMITEYELKRLR